MKRFLLLPCALLLLLCAGCAARTAAPASAQFSIAIATDLHYLAPSLTDGGAYFQRMLSLSDGKTTAYCEELTDAFLAQVVAQQLDALVLTGDLTFNGALQSHEALAQKLAAVEAAGVPVYVLPGNHDVYNTNAAQFSADSYTRVPSATSAQFQQIYAAFGWDEALAQDDDSLSYTVALNDNTLLLMLDANTRQNPGTLSQRTLWWVYRQLKSARANGKTVLVAAHQNLFQQSLFSDNYAMDCADALLSILKKLDAKLFLSGHMHIQHIAQQDGITEIAGSALSVYPCQYGLLSEENGHTNYRTEQVDVAAWALANGRTESELLDFSGYAQSCLDKSTAARAYDALLQLDATLEEKAPFVGYLQALNRAYFCGDLRGLSTLDPDGTLRAQWIANGGFIARYVTSIQAEEGCDYTQWNA